MDKIPKIGVGVFVFKNGKFLIGKRRNAHGDGTWSVPGGHLEFGEELEETAEREVREETGLEIDNVRFGAVTNDIFDNENKHYLTVWMLSNWLSGVESITEPDKFVQQRWVDFETLPKNLFLPWDQLKTSIFYDEIKTELTKTAIMGTNNEI
jgi:8-oxo-dGTP diphosphatase